MGSQVPDVPARTQCYLYFRNYFLLDLGKPHHAIRCMVQVHSKVWLGYRNRIHVVDPQLMCVEATLDAHPRKESQVCHEFIKQL